ncbi:helix-turn-helix domain-containing protein [Cardinium endosymbiont of Oedothorax gibbosus]|uniref:helix-turn-helix domain-containing protein n=1 Tax=Cardinium endosymbiont of Oedothorax gibbosus TaxID=931101 RepID=UPI002024AE2E|nr:helix-turn-helix domain-containing protein [Cardinium endosymbiont of Oedothorax gibbosus]CAH2559857.1 DNA binding HTH Fis-type domain-containing protein [Cardinium endosymbiont of Oedothorax gibbosus]
MEQLTEKHKRKIIQEAIKETGYQVEAVAKGLIIARNTLYKRLKEAELEDSFIIHVSNIIHYDFSKVLPEVYERVAAKVENNPRRLYLAKSGKHNASNELPHYGTEYKNSCFIQLQALSGKYLRLMEDYCKLLKILVVLANSSQFVGIKKEIMEFLKNEAKED